MCPSTSDPATAGDPERPVPGASGRAARRLQRADRQTDVVLIGAGPIGENVAQYAVEGAGIRVLRGHARLVGERLVHAATVAIVGDRKSVV